MPRLQIFFLKVSAHVLLKLAVKGFIKSKKLENVHFWATFLKQKRRSAAKKIEVPIDLTSLDLAQLHVTRK